MKWTKNKSLLQRTHPPLPLRPMFYWSMELLKKPSASASGQIICQLLDCQLKPLFREVCLPGGRQDIQLVWTTWGIISPSPKNDIRSSGVERSMKHTLSLSHTMRIRFHFKKSVYLSKRFEMIRRKYLTHSKPHEKGRFSVSAFGTVVSNWLPFPPEGTWQPAPKTAAKHQSLSPFVWKIQLLNVQNVSDVFVEQLNMLFLLPNIPRKIQNPLGDVGFMRVASHFSLEPVLDLLDGVFFLNKTIAKKSSAPKCFPRKFRRKTINIINFHQPLGLL